MLQLLMTATVLRWEFCSLSSGSQGQTCGNTTEGKNAYIWEIICICIYMKSDKVLQKRKTVFSFSAFQNMYDRNIVLMTL